MGVRNLPQVIQDIEAIGDVAVSTLYDSLREAGEIAAREKARGMPVKTGRLRESINVWYSKSKSRRYRAGVFRIGFMNRSNPGKPFWPNFYSVLFKGRRTKNGRRGFKAPYPGIDLPINDTVLMARIQTLTKSLFDAKMNTVDKARRS